MSLVKQLAGQTAIYGISHVLSRILYFVLLTIYLTRRLTEVEYGIFNDIYFYIGILLIFLTYRMETALFRFGSKSGQLSVAFRTALTSIFGTGLLFAFLGTIFHKQIASLFLYEGRSELILFMIFIVVLDAVSAIPFAYLRLTSQPKRFAILKVVNILITILLVLFFLDVCPWLADQGVALAEVLYDDEKKLNYVFLANLIASTSIFLLLTPLLKGFRFQLDKNLWRKMVIYALPLIIVGIAGVVNQSAAVSLQKYLLPGSVEEALSEAGVYSAAAKLALILNLFAIAFNYAAEPFFFRQANRSENRDIYGKVAFAFVLVASLLLLGVLLYIDVIQLILGENFRSGIYIIPILLAAYFLLGVYYNLSIWYKLSDKTIYGGIISLIGSFVTIVLSVALLPKYGYVASAWAALACYLIMNVVCYLWGQKHYPIVYPLRDMFIVVVLTWIFYYISMYVGFSDILLNLAVKTGLLLGFVGAIWVIFKNKIRILLKT